MPKFRVEIPQATLVEMTQQLTQELAKRSSSPKVQEVYTWLNDSTEGNLVVSGEADQEFVTWIMGVAQGHI